MFVLFNHKYSLALHLAISQQVKFLGFYTPISANEVAIFGIGVKLISLSDDYCLYSEVCDNKTITVARILN